MQKALTGSPAAARGGVRFFHTAPMAGRVRLPGGRRLFRFLQKFFGAGTVQLGKG